MALSTGDRIGAYEIVSLLGKGGMGEVYRARDSKLNRDVAIKVLPPYLAGDADYLARFRREAQTLASLNHPNIAAVYGLEGNAIVMELVEGSTLQGPLPLAEALAVARQIAEALEAAHEKGIIHRDLKPGNVLVTASGVVKVLDFGLAKALERGSATGPDSPTLSMRATEAGMILGTAGYMSPEQAAGKPVDRRADIWSFGVVLLELLTGKRLFDGETVSHTLADVLRAEIDLTVVPAGTIRELLRRCLDRNLKSRLRDIGEARIAIENYSPTTPAAAVATKASYWPWAVAAVCLAIGAAGWLKKPADLPPAAKFDVLPPEGGQFGDVGNYGGSAISPDGRILAFGGLDVKGVRHLYIRPLDSLEARALPGTEDSGRPFWSPDSKSIGFIAGGKLKRVDLAGGSPITLADAPSARGGTWNEDGVILYAARGDGLLRIPASGGTAAKVTTVNMKAGETFHYYPQFLPDGKRFLYMIRQGTRTARMMLGTLDGKTSEPVLETDFQAIYDPASRSLLYMQGAGTLMARRIDFDPPRLSGDPAIVVEGVRGSPRNGYAEYSISRTGALFYGRGDSRAEQSVIWRDREGKRVGQVGRFEILDIFRLSPDGGRIAYSTGDSRGDIWVVDSVRGASSRISFNGGRASVWSHDGKHIYYRSGGRLFRKAADGSGEDEIVLKEFNGVVYDASPDGKHLLLGGQGIQVLPLTANAKPEPYVYNPKFIERGARFSPDGKWVVYESDESGRPEVYVQGFPERRGKWMVSAGSGRNPVWRGDGKELYWTDLGNTLMAASIELSAASVKPGLPHPLFRDAGYSFEADRDGKRFLVAEREGSEKPIPPMVVVQNWAGRLGK